MSDDLLCDPCQRFLRGGNLFLNQENGYLNFAHHATAESFKQALALPCGICRRLRAEFSRQMRRRSDVTFEVAPTVYHLLLSEAKEENVEEDLFPRFTCSEITVYLTLTPKVTTKEPRYSLLAPSGVALAERSLASDHTGSDACIDFILSQLRQCRDTHTKCQSMRPSRQRTGGFLPTRMIDVGRIGDSIVRLIEIDDHAGETPYIALSHCWGNSQPLQLTRTNAQRLKAGIPSTELPKTFQDAIHVTRKMDIRFLWIDSLCIVQDDPQDWHREAACMQDVYSRARCCIAATAAKDGNIGLFFDRDTQGLLPIQVDTSRARMHGQNTNEPLLAYVMGSVVITTAMAIDDAPLNQRAWVAQERYLSTGTIHFTQELLFWECYESVTSEQDPDGRVIKRATMYLGDSAVHTLKSRICDYQSELAIASRDLASVEWLSRAHKDWCHFRTEYSSLSLTKEGDIFVALKGIAQAVAEVTKDALIAGLWRERLIEELCWRRLNNEWVHPADAPPKPSIWRAPTWSWASINRTIGAHELWWEDESVSDCMNEMAVLEDITIDQEPSGQLIKAAITLRCRLIPISPPDSGLWGWVPYKVIVILDDCTIINAKKLGEEMSLVLLRHYGDKEEDGIQGIVVLPSRVKTGSYERVGYFELTVDSDDEHEDFQRNKGTLRSLFERYHNARETTIELV